MIITPYTRVVYIWVIDKREITMAKLFMDWERVLLYDIKHTIFSRNTEGNPERVG